MLMRTERKPIFYTVSGPLHRPLRVAAMQRALPGFRDPLIFLVGEER